MQFIYYRHVLPALALMLGAALVLFAGTFALAD